MTKNLTTTVDLMRHGEPVGGRRYRGQLDDPLSELGWQQMRGAVPQEIPWQHIVSSPLSRCYAFAEELGRLRGLPVVADDRLKEMGFGVWEGMTAEQLCADEPEILERFKSDPVGHRPQGAEALVDFAQRVNAALADAVGQYAGGHVLIVAHAGVIRAAMCAAVGAPIENMFRIQVRNASLTRLQFAAGQSPSLLFHAGRV